MDYFLPFAQERSSCGRALGSLAGNVDGGEGLVQARVKGRDFPPHGKWRCAILILRDAAFAASLDEVQQSTPASDASRRSCYRRDRANKPDRVCPQNPREC